MSDASQTLGDRIRELRRRHFGPQGRERFAAALGIERTELDRFERGTLPPGETLVRMCELTGEDLQWLLTGQESRSTVVISGARNRHRDLLARIAKTLEQSPKLAAPIEAFVELLTSEERVRRALPAPTLRDLVPVYAMSELPEEWPGGEPDGPSGGGLPLAASGTAVSLSVVCEARLTDAGDGDANDATRRNVELVAAADAPSRRYIRCPELLACLPDAVAVELDDDRMRPMFAAGDLLVGAPSAEPQLGRPALVRLTGEETPVRCRVWLGREGDLVHLGRCGDGSRESAAAAALRWAFEVLFRVTRAA